MSIPNRTARSGAVSSRFSNTYFPRSTGDVRSGCEVMRRKDPCPRIPPPRGITDGDLSKLRARDNGDAIEVGKRAVDEGEIRIKQADERKILLHETGEQFLRLDTHGIPDVAIEFRIGPFGRTGGLQVAELQPLTREVADELPGPEILQHTIHLLIKIDTQFPSIGALHQPHVRHGAPQKA